MTRLSLVALGLSLSTNAFAGFATDTISATSGFGSIIDSGPAKFSSALIDARMADLAADASANGCTAVEWAGTWVRGRSPRLQGATDAGGNVTGPSITNGSVDGTGFTSTLASDGQVVGSTDAGNALVGYFARIGTARSIWYGVETDCSPSEPLPSLLAYYDFDSGLADQVGNAPTLTLVNGATLTGSGGGFSGAPGDVALDLGVASNGAVAATTAGPHFDAIVTNNEVAVSWWQNSIQTAPTSSFGFLATGVPSHALQVHATWIDGVTYFDHGTCCGAGNRITASPGPIQLNTWQHILVQKDATGMRQIWIDGSLQAFQGGGNALPPYTGAIGIGGFDPFGSNSFGGRIDDFAVFSEALTEDQIALLAAGGSPLDL